MRVLKTDYLRFDLNFFFPKLLKISISSHWKVVWSASEQSNQVFFFSLADMKIKYKLALFMAIITIIVFFFFVILFIGFYSYQHNRCTLTGSFKAPLSCLLFWKKSLYEVSWKISFSGFFYHTINIQFI